MVRLSVRSAPLPKKYRCANPVLRLLGRAAAPAAQAGGWNTNEY